jgi:hypothetical protein
MEIVPFGEFCFHEFRSKDDTPTNFVRDPNVGPIMKQQKKKRIGACSLTYNTSGVGRHVRVSG